MWHRGRVWGRTWGRTFPKGPWASCQGYGVPAKSIWLLQEKCCRVVLGQAESVRALCTVLGLTVDRAASSLACRGLAGVPREPQGFWVCFEGLSGAGGCVDGAGSVSPGPVPSRVTGWAGEAAGMLPPASAPLPETRSTLTKASACLPIDACCRTPNHVLAEPRCAGRAWGGAGVPRSLGFGACSFGVLQSLLRDGAAPLGVPAGELSPGTSPQWG